MLSMLARRHSAALSCSCKTHDTTQVALRVPLSARRSAGCCILICIMMAAAETAANQPINGSDFLDKRQ